VQVALHPTPFGISAGDHAGSRGAKLVGLASKLVEGTLQGSVQLSVVHGETDLARELGEHAVVFFSKADRSFATSDNDNAEQLTGMANGRDAKWAACMFGDE
jgi:hypothetical protein